MTFFLLILLSENRFNGHLPTTHYGVAVQLGHQSHFTWAITLPTHSDNRPVNWNCCPHQDVWDSVNHHMGDRPPRDDNVTGDQGHR